MPNMEAVSLGAGGVSTSLLDAGPHRMGRLLDSSAREALGEEARTLGTLLELGAERNSTIAFPVPMELLRLVDKAAAEAARGD